MGILLTSVYPFHNCTTKRLNQNKSQITGYSPLKFKEILVQEQYQDIYMAQDLLKWIEEIENP